MSEAPYFASEDEPMSRRRCLQAGVFALVLPPYRGQLFAQTRTESLTLLTAPIEMIGDWGHMIPGAAAKIVEGRKVAERVSAMVVPGSGLVKEQAEAEGLDKVFLAAGFEWREPGCSMCLAMNPDKLSPGERCASTSNRNFEGRQGYKGRTHLVSPAMAAAAAVAGRFVDIRDWK